MAEDKKAKKTFKAYKKKRTCPKCGPGHSLAEHNNRFSCGRCGYLEAKPK